MKITDQQMQIIASYMQDDIREDLHFKLAPCDHETFIKEYLKRDPGFSDLLQNEFNLEF